MQAPQREIRISVADQRLDLFEGGRLAASFPVSTAAAGIGTEPGSNKTPPGLLRVSERFGDGAPPGAVFRSRAATGEFGREEDPEDLVQTRILWLEGAEPGNENTKSRYIYIHGTNHESDIGRPVSHGCIRMRNADVIALYALAGPGTPVRVIPPEG
jgi:lipoprotein-anchoring transpeptidase ErfK/SrfK